MDVRTNGRREKWGVIVTNLREMGLLRNDFNGQVSLHFHNGHATRYEVREVGQVSDGLDNRYDERLDSS